MPVFRIRVLASRAIFLSSMVLAGCSTAHYRKSADKEVYNILLQKEVTVLGKTNNFNIKTAYSARQPDDIKGLEIIQDRLFSDKRKLNLDGALQTAIASNRTYQFRKEGLYLSALALTQQRYAFKPKFFAGSTVSATRYENADVSGQVSSQVGVDQLLKSGASLGLTIANDLLRFYTGDARPAATTLVSVDLLQPLLRGGNSKIVEENLTQAERNIVYEIRSFSHFQHTFALDIVATYYRQLQQKDTVRNEYHNYQNLVMARERAEALSRDRLPAFQVDQASQDELRAKSRYILAVERYLATMDDFKTQLGLPLGVEITLDDKALEDLTQTGLIPVILGEEEGYQIAVAHRLDLLNAIDRFEDSKRKIKVAADQLKGTLNIFANASLPSQGPTDYAAFDINRYRSTAGLQLNLPWDRLSERNDYRSALINFEREIRALSLALDDSRDEVRQGIRSLEQARQNYQIQKGAVELADRRVDSATILLQAGRAQIRDLLEAQSAQLQARNAVTQALVDYHVARLQLLLNLGALDTGQERFWLRDQPIPGLAPRVQGPSQPTGQSDEIIPPDQLFGTQP